MTTHHFLLIHVVIVAVLAFRCGVNFEGALNDVRGFGNFAHLSDLVLSVALAAAVLVWL